LGFWKALANTGTARAGLCRIAEFAIIIIRLWLPLLVG